MAREPLKFLDFVLICFWSCMESFLLNFSLKKINVMDRQTYGQKDWQTFAFLELLSWLKRQNHCWCSQLQITAWFCLLADYGGMGKSQTIGLYYVSGNSLKTQDTGQINKITPAAPHHNDGFCWWVSMQWKILDNVLLPGKIVMVGAVMLLISPDQFIMWTANLRRTILCSNVMIQ